MRAWTTRSAESRLATYAMPLVTALLVASIVGAYFVHTLQHRQAQKRFAAERQVVSHADMLKHQLDHVLTAPALLSALLQSNLREDNLDALARQIIKLQDGLGALQIAPDGVPWRTYDVGATEAAIGQRPSGPSGAKVGAELMPLGPLKLTADQNGLVASQPIYARIEAGEPRFWGYATAIVRIPGIVAASHLDQLHAEGYDYELSYQHQGTETKQVILNSGHSTQAEPAVHSIRLPNGDTFLLAVTPLGGWSPGAEILFDLALTLLAGGLLGAFVFQLLRRPQYLEREVALRTHDLAEAKTSLEREIAVRADAEKAVQRSHALLDSVFEHMPNMIVIKRVSDLRMVRVNRYCEQLLGQGREALLGHSLEELFPPEQAQRLTEADFDAIRTCTLIDLPEERFELPGAAPHWLHLKKKVLTDQAGNPEYLLVLGEDITERKKLTVQLSEHLNFLEQLLDAIPSPVFFKDKEGRYLGINSAFERFFGNTRDQLVGKTVYDIAPKELADIYRRADNALLDSGETQTYESAVQCVDGVPRDVIFNKAVFHSTDGAVGGLVGVVLDITGRKAAERRIEQLNRTFAVVSETNQAIVRIRDRAKLLERACEVLVEKGGFPIAWIGLSVAGSPNRTLAIKGAPREFVQRIVDMACISDHPCEPPGHAPDSALPRFCNSLSGCDQRLIAEAKRIGLTSLAVLPLSVSGVAIGSLGIFGDEEDLFDEAERQLLCALADDLSFALEALDQDDRRRLAESSLRLAAQVFENSSEGVMITDADNRIQMVNKAFTTVTGYSKEEVLGKKPDLLSSGAQTADFYREMWHALRTGGEWHGEIVNRRKNGEVYSEWLTLGVAKSEAGDITNYVAVFSDITMRKQAEQRLNFLANYDVLTALPNRVLFTDRIEQCLALAHTDDRYIGLMLLDLDRFKLINDTFGHSAGDLMLREISTRLQNSVAPGDSVSRLGGDQFAIILPTITSSDEAAVIATRILASLEQPMQFGSNELFTSASIGISVFPDDGADTETLVKNAESAMYQAMEAGGNSYRFYHQQMNSRSSARMTMEGQLRHAMERGELEVQYQPFVHAQSGRIVGGESLLRWQRGEEGYIPPEAFIPLLEENGLIVPVGEWVLRTACTDNQLWRKLADPALFVAVNVSALQLTGDGFILRIRELLEEIGFDPSRLEIELTESALMRDPERGLATMHQLKELGVSLSVDDFGTGYSSLSYLKRFPIDALKIDRSFVQGLPTEPGAITQAIIAMAHSLNLKVIAEGAESVAQVEFLQRARCDLLQGYYFSPAVSQQAFLALLKAQPYISGHRYASSFDATLSISA